MISMNQLSMSAQDLQDSNGCENNNSYHINNNNSLKKNSLINTSLFDNQSNSRQLFRKCKQIIQQQMIQINGLSKQNEKLTRQISQWQQNSQEKQAKIKQLMRDNIQVKERNELLHKQMTKLKKVIEDLNKQIQSKQNIIKLKQNNIQLLSSNLNKTMIQTNALQEKSVLLQQTVQLYRKELKKAEQIISQKDNQMKSEINQLRRVKMILQRNNKVEGIDQMIFFENSKDNRYRSDSKNDKFIYRPYFTTHQQQSPFNKVNLKQQINNINDRTLIDLPKRESPFYSAQLTKHPNIINKFISPFSIVDQAQSTSSISRIRKNLSKPKNHFDTQTQHATKSTVSKSKQRENLTEKLSNKKQKSFMINNTSQLTNPEISQELSNIKKQILQQYNKMQIKKGMISHDRINQTLQQIENKLQKMVKISTMDQSQSEFQ